MSIGLPEMSFDFGDLEPVMSRDTLSFHFSRHHADHFDRTVALARGTEFEGLTLEDLVRAAAGRRAVRSRRSSAPDSALMNTSCASSRVWRPLFSVTAGCG